MSPITVKQPMARSGQQYAKNNIEFADGEADDQDGSRGGRRDDREGTTRDKYNYNEMLQAVDSPDRMGGFKSEVPGGVGRGGGGGGMGMGGKQLDGSTATGPREGYKTVFSSLMSSGGTGSDTGKAKRLSTSTSSSSSSWKGYYEVEAPVKKQDGEGKVLFIYGDCMDCFTDNPNVLVDCTEVVFRYIDVDTVLQFAPHIFLNTKASKLSFSHNSFKAFSQIQKLNLFCLGLSGGEEGGAGGILGGGRRITEIDISPEGNPCASLSTYREFCAFAMNKLDVLDGVELSREERESGRRIFGALKSSGGDGTRSISQHLPANLFKTGGRGLGLFSRPGSSAASAGGGGGGKSERSSGSGGGDRVNAAHADDLAIARCTERLVINMANMAIDINKKRQTFKELYPAIIRDIMDEAIHQKINQESFMENCLEQLLV
jgi:hypothetical protein